MATPWPGQRTGIADYAYDLAAGMVAQGHKLTVVTTASPPRPLSGVSFLTPEDYSVAHHSEMDQLVYHLGNNSNFHIFQLPMLVRFPGVVHLHDMVLHHLMAWILVVHAKAPFYRRAVARWYGPAVAELAERRIATAEPLWNSQFAVDVPMFEEPLQYAIGLVTNSRFACERVKARFPGLPALVVPQLYRDGVVRQERATRPFYIGVFGGVAPNKQVDVVIEACRQLVASGHSIELHITGKVEEVSRPLIDALMAGDLALYTQLHGYTEHDDFLARMAQMDVCVALRNPTMGETSAIAMRALQSGVPVIVSDVGWYRELPDFVTKLPLDKDLATVRLTQTLGRLIDDPSAHDALASTTRSYAQSELNFEAVISEYCAFLSQS